MDETESDGSLVAVAAAAEERVASLLLGHHDDDEDEQGRDREHEHDVQPEMAFVVMIIDGWSRGRRRRSWSLGRAQLRVVMVVHAVARVVLALFFHRVQETLRRRGHVVVVALQRRGHDINIRRRRLKQRNCKERTRQAAGVGAG